MTYFNGTELRSMMLAAGLLLLGAAARLGVGPEPDDFTWTSDLVSDQDREAYAASVANYVDFSVETIADRTAVGNENWYVVSSPEEVSAAGASDEGISVYRVVRSGDAWMIDLHRFTGLPG